MPTRRRGAAPWELLVERGDHLSHLGAYRGGVGLLEDEYHHAA